MIQQMIIEKQEHSNLLDWGHLSKLLGISHEKEWYIGILISHNLDLSDTKNIQLSLIHI